MIKFLTIFYVLILFTSRCYSQDIDAILDNYYKHVGGKEKWEKVESAIFVYQSNSLVDMLNVNRVIMEYKKTHGKKINKKKQNTIYERWVSFEIGNIEDTVSTCYNGETYLRHVKGEAPEIFDYYAERYGKFVRMGEPVLFLRAEAISLVGQGVLSNNDESEIPCYLLQIVIDNTSLIYYINTKTFQLEASHREGHERVFTYYSEYKVVGGLIFHMREITYSNSILVSDIIYDSIEINPEISDALFSYPQNPNIVLNRSDH